MEATDPGPAAAGPSSAEEVIDKDDPMLRRKLRYRKGVVYCIIVTTVYYSFAIIWLLFSISHIQHP